MDHRVSVFCGPRASDAGRKAAIRGLQCGEEEALAHLEVLKGEEPHISERLPYSALSPPSKKRNEAQEASGAR